MKSVVQSQAISLCSTHAGTKASSTQRIQAQNLLQDIQSSTSSIHTAKRPTGMIRCSSSDHHFAKNKN
ncbi:hypothetical protein LEL_04903 [Akanthomyces lecanii RCEF 1005]|uniref:Uncharacterized protein n=1 Tax=Akanthomyces lecanii RCEF 1005 TaxID=1081108 RepID=A0A168HQ43_CORDF|nr:hypothetical protein LEL_04903 [Akanthomyces lecanii RCEF 1005]